MSKRKLLLADDSVTIQKVVNLTFADEGIEVISVGDGDSAMLKVAEISPDLIMADVNMPGLTGYEICERIRADENLRNTPVILLVGSFEPFDEAEAKRVGADDFLTKPFQSIRQLVNKVTILLNSGREGVSVAAPVATEGSSYLETLEIEKPTTSFSPVETSSYQNSNFADDSVEVSTISNYALDDTQKFEAKNEIPSQTDLLKTQPLSNEDFDRLDLAKPSLFSNEAEYAYVNPQDSSHDILETGDLRNDVLVENINNYSDADENILPIEDELPEAAAVLQLDDDDPLELPPIDFDFDDEDDEDDYDEVEGESQFEAETPKMLEKVEAAVQPPVLKPSEEFEQPAHIQIPANQANLAANFSPDLIEAIVQKVLERLSDKVVREVAWDVVPPMTELIVKKMAEEKLKQ